MPSRRRKTFLNLAACFGTGVATACVLIGVVSQTVEGPTFAVEVEDTRLPVAAESITATRMQPVSPFESVPVQRPEALEAEKAALVEKATETAQARREVESVWTPDVVPPAALFAVSRTYNEPWRGQWSPDDVGPPIQRPSSLRAPRWNPNVALPPI